MGVKYVALSVSGTVAGGAMPRLALWVGWPSALALVGGLLLASALSALLLYRDWPPERPRAAFRPAAASRHALWGDQRFWRLVTVGFLFAGVQYAFITYLVLFLQETWGLSLPLAASLLALAQGAAAASRVPSGWVSDRWLKGERLPLLRGMGVLAMGALLALLLLPQGGPALVLAAVMLLFGMSGLSWAGIYQTCAAEFAGRDAAGLGSGIATACFQVGSLVTPPVFGYVVDVTGAYTVSWGMLVLWLLLGIGLLGRVRRGHAHGPGAPPLREHPPAAHSTVACGAARSGRAAPDGSGGGASAARWGDSRCTRDGTP
jgi:nitrate/nitrite transporter NarK